jgi:hypothetical protein
MRAIPIVRLLVVVLLKDTIFGIGHCVVRTPVTFGGIGHFFAPGVATDLGLTTDLQRCQQRNG